MTDADVPIPDRIDALVGQLRQARRLVVTPSVRAILTHTIDELSYIRADLRRAQPRGPRRRRPPPPGDPGPRTTADGLNPHNRRVWLEKNNEANGTRFCPTCQRWRPFAQFDRKTPTSATYRSHCRDCWKAYQRERYVAAGKTAVILEVLEGDEIVGATCNCCGRPFEIGDLLAAGALKHRDCQPAPAAAEPSDTSDTNTERCAARWMYRGRARAVCHGPVGHEGRHWNGTVKWSDETGARPEAPPSGWAADLRARADRIKESHETPPGRNIPTATPPGRMTAEQDRLADMLADRHAAATGIPRP